MATYVNDLRLKEIATGDESGTWGTSTNTNLELIAEAFSYGTEASFGSDADATTTIADGATDPARSLYFKVTSGVSLTATRTLTLAPNDVSKVWIIENATSGSQSINISQGSGSSVTIGNGDVKIVYSDGGGASANVVDAFTDLSVTDKLKIEGSTPTLTIGDGGAEDTKIVFDGNAQDYYVGLDDSADDLVIGVGSTVGTTPAIIVNESQQVGIGVAPTHNFNLQGTGTVEARFRSTDGDCSLQISSDTDEGQDSILEFTSGTSGRGRIVYDHNPTAASQKMIFKTGDVLVDAMQIDGSGNVAIQNSSPNPVPLHVGGTSHNDLISGTQLLVSGTSAGAVALGLVNGNGTGVCNIVFGSTSDGNEGEIAYNLNSDFMQFNTSGTERMRINSSGGVCVGTTSGPGAGNIIVNEGIYIGVNNGDYQIRSSSAGGGSATLYIGNAAIQVSSDERLKTNIVDTSISALDKINQVRVVDFEWNDPTDTSYNNRNARGLWTGVIAQEIVDVFPFAVNAPRNEEDLSIDNDSENTWQLEQGALVPVLIKAIQEQQTIIDDLKTRIETLENA